MKVYFKSYTMNTNPKRLKMNLETPKSESMNGGQLPNDILKQVQKLTLRPQMPMPKPIPRPTPIRLKF